MFQNYMIVLFLIISSASSWRFLLCYCTPEQTNHSQSLSDTMSFFFVVPSFPITCFTDLVVIARIGQNFSHIPRYSSLRDFTIFTIYFPFFILFRTAQLVMCSRFNCLLGSQIRQPLFSILLNTERVKVFFSVSLNNSLHLECQYCHHILPSSKVPFVDSQLNTPLCQTVQQHLTIT